MESARVIVIPAVAMRRDMSSGAKGQPLSASTSAPVDALEVVRELDRCGFSRLHVVEETTGATSRRGDLLLRDVVRETSAEVQLSAPFDGPDLVADWLQEGIRYVVVDASSKSQVATLVELAARFPGQLMARARVARRGLLEHAGRVPAIGSIHSWLDDIEAAELSAMLLVPSTDDGGPAPPDLPWIEDLVDAAGVPILVGGDLSTLGGLRALEERGVTAAVVDARVLLADLNAWMVAEEFRA